MKTGVFIIGTPIHNYTRVIRDAFVANGMDAACETYSYPNPFLKSIPIISYLYSGISERISGDKFYKQLNNKNCDFRILLLFGMDNISLGKLTRLKKTKKIKIALWFIDSIYAYKNLYSLIDIADYMFCYNRSDAEELRKMGKNSLFLPLAYDSASYFKFETEKKYDLYFVGALRSRIDNLEKLLIMLQALKLKIRIDGKLSYLFRLKNRNRYPNFFSYHTNLNADHKSINTNYNSSKICLNIQPKQAESAFSIRTYEICGAGGFQLTNGNEELLSTLFTTGEDLVYFKDIDELADKIKYFLKPENSDKLMRISLKGNNCAIRKHSFNRRISEVIEFIKNDNKN